MANLYLCISMGCVYPPWGRKSIEKLAEQRIPFAGMRRGGGGNGKLKSLFVLDEENFRDETIWKTCPCLTRPCIQ